MSGDGISIEQKADKRRYNYMENVLQHVIPKISVNDEDSRINNQILKEAIDTVVGKMRETSTLFDKLFQRQFYGGSYYDNLKTGKPDEYDIDLLMVLSKKQVFNLKPINAAPGFVELQYAGSDTNFTSSVAELFDGEYLCADKVKKWMEGIMTKTMAELPKSGNQCVLNIQNTEFFIKFIKSGPAFTIKLNGEMDGRHLNFDVDLVPCFLFNASMWPKGKFRKNPVKERTDFFIVPKTPKSTKSVASPTLCWRLSFQEQERVLIHGNRSLKPCIKLMKKLRDKMEQNSISSYFIKTMFMWEVEKQDKSFWENSLSYVFVEMLQVYERRLRERNIPYYWNTDNNLIDGLCEKSKEKSDIMIDNYANRVKRIVTDIQKKSNDPYFVATFFLNEAEMEQIKIDVPVQIGKQKAEVQYAGNGSNNGGNGGGNGNSANVAGNGNGNSSGNGNGIKSKCTCGGRATSSGDLDNAIREMRMEIEEARREQEANKMETLELLRVVMKRLDQIDAKLS